MHSYVPTDTQSACTDDQRQCVYRRERKRVYRRPLNLEAPRMSNGRTIRKGEEESCRSQKACNAHNQHHRELQPKKGGRKPVQSKLASSTESTQKCMKRPSFSTTAQLQALASFAPSKLPLRHFFVLHRVRALLSKCTTAVRCNQHPLLTSLSSSLVLKASRLCQSNR